VLDLPFQGYVVGQLVCPYRAEQLVVFPPLTPEQLQVQGPEPDKAEGVPIEQMPTDRDAYGPVLPQLPFAFTLDEQVAVLPPDCPTQDQ